MLIRVNGTDFHADATLGQILIAAGLAFEIKPPVPRPPANTRWGVGALCHNSRYEFFVHGKCSSCGEVVNVFNATENFRFWHCGVPGGEAIPANVLKEYQARAANPPKTPEPNAAERLRRSVIPIGAWADNRE